MTARTGQIYFRADQGRFYYWDGSRWLGTADERIMFVPTTTIPFSATVNGYRAGAPLMGDQDIYLVTFRMPFFVSGGSALSGSHKWAWGLEKLVTGGTATTVVSGTIDSGASSVWRNVSTVSVNALLNNGTTHYAFRFLTTKTGTPGDLFCFPELTYKRVGT